MGPGVWKPPIGHHFEKLNFEKYINGGNLHFSKPHTRLGSESFFGEPTVV